MSDQKSKFIDLLEYEDRDIWSQTWADNDMVFVNMSGFSFNIPVNSFGAWVSFLKSSFDCYLGLMDNLHKGPVVKETLGDFIKKVKDPTKKK